MPEEIAKLTLDLVKLPSPTGQELDMAKFYANTLERIGLDVTLEYVEENRPNVIAKLPGSGTGRNLLFFGHMDTVPHGNCVAPRIAEGRIYGRGSCDMKGSLASIVQAIKAITQSRTKLGGDVFVGAHVGHESPKGSGEGIKAIAKSIREGKLKVEAGINMEGPMDSIKIAQGGSSMFAVSIANKVGTQYSATSTFASNPILWTADVIKELERLDKGLGRKKRHPLIPQRPTVQVGMMQSGDFLFLVPSTAMMEGVIRWDPEETFEIVSERFRRTFEKLQADMRRKYGPSVDLSVKMRIDREACVIPEGPVTRSLARAFETVMGQRAKRTGTRWVSDMAIIYREGGIPAVEYGPFLPEELSLAHTDRESMRIFNLETVSKVYAAAMLAFCGVASA